MNNATENVTAAQHSHERHEPWCNARQHEADVAELGPIDCYSRSFASGPVGGWLTANESPDGGVRVAIDWRPATWESLSLDEAASLLGFLAKALAAAGMR